MLLLKASIFDASKIDETVASKSYIDAQIKTVDDKTVALERDLGQYAELPS